MRFSLERIPASAELFTAATGLLRYSRKRGGQMHRRDFLKGAPVAAGLLASAAPAPSSNSSRIVLQPFDYQGVRLLNSRWLDQVQGAQEFYLGVSDDEI